MFKIITFIRKNSMEMFLNELFNSIVQIILFTIIPIIWWLVINRRKENFFKWIGIKKIKDLNHKILFYMIIGILIFFGVGILILYMLRGIETATSKFIGLGIKGLAAAIIYSFLRTALSEEIFFRGFLLKILSNKFGLLTGNIIQGILFGLIHGILFINIAGLIKTIIIIIFTGLIGCFIGYVNEKKTNGSIIFSWIVHGIANLFSSIISLFSLI